MYGNYIYTDVPIIWRVYDGKKKWLIVKKNNIDTYNTVFIEKSVCANDTCYSYVHMYSYVSFKKVNYFLIFLAPLKIIL